MLVVIPLFIGNSARQPAWQLVVSIPAFAVIGCISFIHPLFSLFIYFFILSLKRLDIAYSNVFIELVEKKRIMALGYAYYALDMSMRGIIALTVIVYLIYHFISILSYIVASAEENLTLLDSFSWSEWLYMGW